MTQDASHFSANTETFTVSPGTEKEMHNIVHDSHICITVMRSLMSFTAFEILRLFVFGPIKTIASHLDIQLWTTTIFSMTQHYPGAYF